VNIVKEVLSSKTVGDVRSFKTETITNLGVSAKAVVDVLSEL